MQRQSVEDARILIVDDDEASNVVLAQLLVSNGFPNVRTCSDARHVLPLYLTWQPDLMLLDLRMPQLDGFEVLENIRQRTPREDFFPILMLTGDSSIEARRHALEAGATDFLIKPYDGLEVTLRVKNLLERRQLHEAVHNQKLLVEEELLDRTLELEEARVEILDRLTIAAEYRDDATGDHPQRVGRTSALVAMELGLSDEDVDLLRRAAPLHDIGKIAIADEILLKPGPLNRDEWAVVRTHTDAGASILGGSKVPLLQLAEVIALTHHERWNGKGYSGLAGDAIPLPGRIVGLADVFDALINDRPYKAAWPLEKALTEIQSESGKHFDPEVVEAFMAVQGRENLEVLPELDPTLDLVRLRLNR
jgi:putative two-component system response regulator